MKLYIVMDFTMDSHGTGHQFAMSYWSTLRKAQAAIKRYREAKMLDYRAEIVTVTVDSDAFHP